MISFLSLIIGDLIIDGVIPKAQAATIVPSIDDIVPCSINTYGDAWNGAITFGLLDQTNPASEIDMIIMMNTDGQLQYSHISSGDYDVEPISQDTLMYTGSGYIWGGGDVNFLNLTTNQITSFPNVLTHHDIEYNPINNTFLTLHAYVRIVNGQNFLFDQIVEENASGGFLWTWDTYNHINLSEASPFNQTTVINGTTVIDFTHCNAIQWDYTENIIYLNIKNLNTFYKINETTGAIIWRCGEYGNFTLLNDNGEKVSSLWYNSHDLS